MPDIPPSVDTIANALPQRGNGVNRSFATLRSIAALILREMATRYGRSPGGYIWAVVEPMGMILILAAFFSVLVRVPPLGDNFILFFATGMLPYQLYNSLSNSIARAVNFSRSLLFYPAVTWIDAVLARFILNLLTDVLVMLLLLAIFIAVADITLLLDIGPVIMAVALTAALGLGIGLMNCVLIGFFPVWMNIWSILNRPLFFASGILFIYESIPKEIQTYLWYNPLVHITGLMRAGFYPTYDASYASPIYVLIFAIVPGFFGLLLMGRYHREILNR